MSKMFLMLLGIAPTAAIILYFVLQHFDTFDKNVAVKEVKSVVLEKEFDRDFYEQQADFADTKKEKVKLVKRANQVKDRVIKENKVRKRKSSSYWRQTKLLRTS